MCSVTILIIGSTERRSSIIRVSVGYLTRQILMISINDELILISAESIKRIGIERSIEVDTGLTDKQIGDQIRERGNRQFLRI